MTTTTTTTTTTRRLLMLIGVCLLGSLNTAQANLGEVLERALKTNPDFYAQFNAVKAKEYEVEQARSGYYPTVDVNAGFGTESVDTSGSSTDNGRTELGLSVSQNLFQGFGTNSDVDMKQSQFLAEQWRLESAANDVATQVVEAYLELARSAEQVGVAENKVKIHRGIYAKIKTKVDTGVADETEVLQIENRLAAAESDYFSTKANYMNNYDAFVKVTGQIPPASLNVPDIAPGLAQGSQSQAITQALDNNPTLRAAEADVTAAMYSYEKGQADYYPKVDLDFDYDWEDASAESTTTTLMLNTNWNLYRGGATSATADQNIHLVAQARDRRNASKRDMVSGVQMAWNRLQALNPQFEKVIRQLAFARQTRDAYLSQFDIGKRTLMDVLATETDVTLAEVKLIDTYYGLLMAQYQLAYSQGDLAKNLGIDVGTLSVDESTDGEIAVSGSLNDKVIQVNSKTFTTAASPTNVPLSEAEAPTPAVANPVMEIAAGGGLDLLTGLNLQPTIKAPPTPRMSAPAPTQRVVSEAALRGTGCYVQLASFKDFRLADKFERELERRGQDNVRIVERMARGLDWRVFQIGPFGSLGQAQDNLGYYGDMYRVDPVAKCF